MLAELFAKWMSELPGFILVYLALFGVPRLGVHGFLSSFWKLAENVAGVRTEIKADFQAVKDTQAEIKAAVLRVEENQKTRPIDDGSIRFSVGR